MDAKREWQKKGSPPSAKEKKDKIAAANVAVQEDVNVDVQEPAPKRTRWGF